MAPLARQIYVISDLHIGGQPASGESSCDRGFRMCTQSSRLASFITALGQRPSSLPKLELVINGDFIDFLAEPDGDSFSPITMLPSHASSKLRSIARRERPLFDALSGLLHKGHRLTLLLGNHDIELSFPEVRQTLNEILSLDGKQDFQFIFDNEAYVVGDALIEHGNRYDGFNAVDHDSLREWRSLQSRRLTKEAVTFRAPPGSHLVASVMNPIKREYPFVDLLKPEVEAVVPILLALEPGYRRHIAEVGKLWLEAKRHAPQGAMPGRRGDISASTALGAGLSERGNLAAASTISDDAVLRQMLGTAIRGPQLAAFLAGLPTAPAAEDRGTISSVRRPSGLDRALGIFHLLRSGQSESLEQHLPSLLAAIRVLKDAQTFDRNQEPPTPYLAAARELADQGGFRYVVFGHTHIARQISLGQDASGEERFYLNTGTWADLIELPRSLFDENEERALCALREFVATLRDPSPWIAFHPTYVRLDLGQDGRVTAAELCDYFEEP